MKSVLSNGAEIITMGPYRPDSSRIVLASYLGKYVTWRAYRREGGNAPYDCCWGSYHSTLESAEDDFYKRIAS